MIFALFSVDFPLVFFFGTTTGGARQQSALSIKVS
jgi:hypothetical protein